MNPRNITIKEVSAAVLAILLVGGAIAYSLINLVSFHGQLPVPDWLTLGVGAAIGFYFGQQSASSAVQASNDGTARTIAATQVATAEAIRSLQNGPVTPPEGP